MVNKNSNSDKNSSTIFCGKVPVRFASIVVAILSAIGAFFMGLVSGLIAAGLTGEEIKLPTYVRLYRSILCVLLLFLVIFALLLLNGIISGKTKLLVPWICLISILMIINLLSVIIAVSLGKKLLNSTITEEIVAVTIFTCTCIVMLYIVFSEYKRQRDPHAQEIRKAYLERISSERRVYNSKFLRIVNEAFRQKALQKNNRVGKSGSDTEIVRNGAEKTDPRKKKAKVKMNSWTTPEKRTSKQVAAFNCT